MGSVIELLILAMPLMIVSLLVGLGLCVAVLANEGRGWTSSASQIIGLLNLVMIVPLTLLSWTAETRDVRFMFMFAAGAFAFVGLLGLRVPRRFRD